MPLRGPHSVLWIVVVTTSACSTRVGVLAGGDEAGEVGHVDHQLGADGVGNRAEGGEIELAGVGRPAGDDQLGPVLVGEPLDLLHVDPQDPHGGRGRRFTSYSLPETLSFIPWVGMPAVVQRPSP